ncbi:D-methionine-binding lipoprotein metQ [Caballeronia cordobensis]|uniref:D-methionine-binding lipoprotein metQ n=1 Tax=Caballeronia cordobensis TaxID=1353886 RepID=A0A158GN47_CABCO|nr:D-methionine-binding lipoprotein metQ [Caballeronia cordobensis]
MKTTTPLTSALLSILLAWCVACVQPVQAAGQTVRVGIMSGEDEDVWHTVAANAANQGITVNITTFADYTQPNEALAQHDLDANSSQHKLLRASQHAHAFLHLGSPLGRITFAGDALVVHTPKGR